MYEVTKYVVYIKDRKIQVGEKDAIFQIIFLASIK